MNNDTLLKSVEVAEARGVLRQHVVDLCGRFNSHRRTRRADLSPCSAATR